MGRELLDLVVERIRRQGPLTFAEYMDLALYHPAYGYYASAVRTGRGGDYYTAPSVHPVFGALLAEQIAEMWRLAGAPPAWRIVEYGAGPGWLAGDILEALEGHHPDCFAAARYEIVETAPAPQAAGEGRLRERFGPRVRWFREPPAGAAAGCVLANEFLDALPFHLVRGEPHGGLSELYVGWDGSRLVEVPGPPSSPRLEEYLACQGVRLAPGQRAEVGLAVLDWVDGVARLLARGYALILDYGLSAAELYHSDRAGGTLRCFRRHRLCADPLVAVGEQDITAHVNFSAVAARARARGLGVLGPVHQGSFLARLVPLLARKRDLERDLGARLALKELLFRMGDVFRVLVLVRDAPASGLTGLSGR
ncbi:MAG: SAM-dependent methyltransferase [Firmicutes bacterium]|nr:SAM-dependent methyltransferase [Bacillota bacterium]